MRFSDCREARKHLARYLDQELGQAETEALEMHLRQCPRCREELARIRRMDRLFRETAAADPGEDYWGTFLTRLKARRAAEEAGKTRGSWWGSLRWAPAWGTATAGAAVVVLALVIFLVHQKPTGLHLVGSFRQPSLEIQSEPGGMASPPGRAPEVTAGEYDSGKARGTGVGAEGASVGRRGRPEAAVDDMAGFSAGSGVAADHEGEEIRLTLDEEPPEGQLVLDGEQDVTEPSAAAPGRAAFTVTIPSAPGDVAVRGMDEGPAAGSLPAREMKGALGLSSPATNEIEPESGIEAETRDEEGAIRFPLSLDSRESVAGDIRFSQSEARVSGRGSHEPEPARGERSRSDEASHPEGSPAEGVAAEGILAGAGPADYLTAGWSDSLADSCAAPPEICARQVLGLLARLERKAAEEGKKPDYSAVLSRLEEVAALDLPDSLALEVEDAIDRIKDE